MVRKRRSPAAVPPATSASALSPADAAEHAPDLEAVQDSEARFAALAGGAPMLVWVGDRDGCRRVNRAFLDFVGAAAADVQGSGWLQFVHADDRAGAAAAYRSAVERRAPFQAQFRLRRHDGEFRSTHTVGAPRFDAERDFRGLVCSIFDVTELKRAEKTLREADATKIDFLAMLAHELRNPLAAIRNSVDVLRWSDATPERIERARDIMERQTGAMIRMVDDLLDVSRITHGTIALHLQDVDLGAVVDHALAATVHLLAERGQHLVLDRPSQPIVLLADRARLEQVLCNLIGNASKFTPDGGRMWLDVRVEAASAAESAGDDEVVIAVRDDGIGIESHLLETVFEPFMQVDRATQRVHGGVGLGLALARQLIELHHGSLTAHSAGLGQGAEFVVRLPAARTTPGASDASGANEAQRVASASRRVLVVDDNVDGARALGLMLEMLGHEPHVVHCGQDALALTDRVVPDLVLLDLSMPGMDGLKLIRALREKAQLKHARVVALTGYSSRSDVERCREAGFDLHVAKPLLPDRLRAIMADLFGAVA